LGLSRLEQAHEVLIEALAESTAEGSHPNVQRFQVLHALSKVEIQRGNITEVELLREEAREIVTAVAENIDDLTLRDSFLATPPVPEIMELS
jgi:hypothetical protein